jgi:glycine oxidase
MNQRAEIIVIGGGLIGGSIAYHLAKKGIRVLLLERDRIALGASSAAAGMLGAQSEMLESGPLFDLARRSRAMFPQLAKELREMCGIDIGLVQRGLLKVAITPEQAEECQRMMAFQLQAGEAAEWLTPKEAKEMEPCLTDSIEGAMYIPGDGQVSAPELAAAYIHAASLLGAVIRENVAVHSLRLTGNKITGVVTDEGPLDCDRVVVAAAIHGNQLLAHTGLNINVFPVKGECFSVTTPAPLLTSTVFADGCYLVPKRRGRLVIGATMIEGAYDRSVSIEGLSQLMSRACALVPAIASARWETAWAGLRPQTIDGLPYLGDTEQFEGLFIASGHYRNGVLLSPVTGELMAELITGNRHAMEPWGAFRTDRHSLHAKIGGN